MIDVYRATFEVTNIISIEMTQLLVTNKVMLKSRETSHKVR